MTAGWERDGKNRLLITESLGEFVQWASADDKYHNDPERRASSRYSDPARTVWTASATLAEAQRHAAGDGWSVVEPVRLALAEVAPIVGTIERRRVIQRRSVAGPTVDIGRMSAGDPRFCHAPHLVPSPRSGRVVRVLVNTTVSYTVSPETMLANGAVLVAFFHALRRAGLGVELWVAQTLGGITSTYAEAKACSLTRVTSPDQAPDEESVMFALAHPSMLRRFMFGAMERLPLVSDWNGWHLGTGYGRPCQAPEVAMELVRPDVTIGAELAHEIPNPGEYITGLLVRLGVAMAA